ncbi:MAG TPA: DUF502 domain-containing protein [Tepidisphaeraceae bacterium]|nr:DUF502 domain-containing protein [Tepidisphaeraceae bacterium]
MIKVWDFLWDSLGQYTITPVRWLHWALTRNREFPTPPGEISRYWDDRYWPFRTHLVGVLLAVLMVYILGVFVGNFIGRALYRLGELLVMRIPLVRAIYPAVKQVTDFLLAERTGQFQGSRVVAVEPHAKGIWSIGLVTGANGLPPLNSAVGTEMVTVFVPSSPTAFSGYVLVVPRSSVIELPMDVEEAMRLLVSGGVLTPREFPPDTFAINPPASLPAGMERAAAKDGSTPAATVVVTAISQPPNPGT